MNFKNFRFPKRPLELLSVQEMDELSEVGNTDERQEVAEDDILPILDVSSSLPNRAKKITAKQLVEAFSGGGGGGDGANLTLSNLTDYDAARNNLDVVSRSDNLSDLDDVSEARANLGHYVNVAAIANADVPSVLNVIWSLGYYEPGDSGGTRHRRKDVGEPNRPGDITSNDGARWEILPPGDLDARSLGLSATQSDAERRQSIQNAIDLGAEIGRKVYIPNLLDSNGDPTPWVLGSVNISEDGITKPMCLRWHSGSYIYGDGKGRTILKLSDNATDNVNLLEPDARDSSTVNWVIEDMTLDGNASRPNVSGTGSFRRPGASCLTTASASFGTIRRIEARHAVLHCIDVCGGGAINGGTEYYVDQNDRAPDFYPNNQSMFVWVEDCEAWDAGDDAFTVHYARKVWFTRCYGHSAGDRHSTSTACNGFEMDDGAREVWVTDCHAFDVNRAFTAKGHNNDPSATNVFFTSIWADSCATGLWCAAPSGAEGNRNVTVNGIRVTNPTNRGISGGGEQGGQQVRAVWISRYHNVQVNNLTAIGVVGDNTLEPAIVAGSSSNGFHLNNFRIENWPEQSTSSTNRAGIYLTSSANNVTIENGMMLNCGWRAIRRSGGGVCNLFNVTIVGNNKSSSIGVDYNQNAALEGSSIAGVSVTGYTNDMRVGGRTGTVTSVLNNIELIRGDPDGSDTSNATIYARRNHLYLEAANTVRSQTIRDNTTSQSNNMWISDSTGAIFRNTSARKYKTDINDVDLETALRFTEQATPVSFKSKSDNDDPDQLFYGYIADDVAEIDPVMVRYVDNEPEGFNYDRVPVLLHVTIKELLKKVKQLEDEIATLKGTN